MLQVYLRDRNPELGEAWKKFFDGPDVHISVGDIFIHFHEKVDAIVSPANSFGFMDGGIDYVYSMVFGWELSEELRRKINSEYDGELLVGQAAIVEIKKANPAGIRYLISAPTMRVPADVSQTANAYLAFRAALKAAEKHEGINSVVCPGLGTAVGRMPPNRCAAQMFAAYRHHYRKPEEIGYNELEEAFAFHHLLLN